MPGDRVAAAGDNAAAAAAAAAGDNGETCSLREMRRRDEAKRSDSLSGTTAQENTQPSGPSSTDRDA